MNYADLIQDATTTTGTGIYHLDYLPTVGGLYTYEWIGTGAVPVAEIGQFLVDPVTF